MGIYKFSFLALIAYAIAAKHLLHMQFAGGLSDYVAAIPVSMIPLAVAVMVALRTPKEIREANASRYITALISGLIALVLFKVMSHAIDN